MNKLQRTSIISRNPIVTYTQIDHELVMLEPEKAVFCNVNLIGSVIWSLLEKSALSLEALCNHIHQHYDVTEAQCVEDITQFINEMVWFNLLTVTNDR